VRGLTKRRKSRRGGNESLHKEEKEGVVNAYSYVVWTFGRLFRYVSEKMKGFGGLPPREGGGTTKGGGNGTIKGG